MSRPRWPRALRVLTEHTVKEVSVYTLACSAAECHACDWRGPLRDDPMRAEHDRANHLDAGHS